MPWSRAARFGERFLLFNVGLAVMSLGIVSTVKARLGVSPWDVFHLGVAGRTGMTFGQVQQVVGLVIVLAGIVLTRRPPSFGTVANMLLVGWYCDWIGALWPHDPPGLWQRIALFAFGVVVWGFGTGLYIVAGLGAGPRDWLMMALHQKTGWRIRLVRTLLEAAAVAAGLMLGGPFFVGTIVFSLTIGWTTEWGLVLAKRLVRERDGRSVMT